MQCYLNINQEEKRNMKKILLILTIFTLSISSTLAIQIKGLTSDRGVFPTTKTYAEEWDGPSDIRVGRGNSDDETSSAIFVFQLPERDGMPIETASLSFYITVSGNWKLDYAVDLYGVRSSSDPAVLTTDGYIGKNDRNATKLQNDIKSTQVSGHLHTDSAGDAALSSWLNGLYDAGAIAGDYAFIRLSVDTPPKNNYHHDSFASANHKTISKRPVLSITIEQKPAPEPITEAIEEPAPEPTIEPLEEIAQKPTSITIIDSASERVEELTKEPTTEPRIDPIVHVVPDPTPEPIIDPAPEPEPITEIIPEPIVEPIKEVIPAPVVEIIPEPIVEPTPEPIAEPIVTQPKPEPIATSIPVLDPIAEPELAEEEPETNQPLDQTTLFILGLYIVLSPISYFAAKKFIES